MLLCQRFRSHTGTALMLTDGASFLGVSYQRCWCLLTNNLLRIGTYTSLHSIITSTDPALPTFFLSSLIIQSPFLPSFVISTLLC